ncbi:MAG: formate dehydrogenase accessory sulfurtransferase FdhD [Bacteroidetes bacterium]|nr:formate dehydrogenase accessory sulfurtransferase FdhD [Bacteroidota bacterium]
MPKASVSQAKILKIYCGDVNETMDLLAIEEPMEIRVGYGDAINRMQKSISVTMRTPGNDFELAVGFLYTEGIIQSAKNIYKIQYCVEANTIENKENIVRVELNENIKLDFARLQRNFYTSSSCGVCGKESIESIKTTCPTNHHKEKIQVSKDIILSLPEKLREKQKVFEYTGGLHACALFDNNGELLLLREDVGRHNALDKLIGALISDISRCDVLSKSILLLSGRASFELLQKAAMAGIQMVCAVGAPSSLAVDIAHEFGITLIGFLKENRFNIYSHSERINDVNL